jgi:O-antigen/teichoic acid export membrane protein
LEIASSFLFSVYNGVLVGCHRWDWHNTVSAITSATLAVGMASMVLGGGGLVQIALVHAVVMTAGEMFRKRLTRAACPELRLDFRLASRGIFWEQAHYSAKSVLPRVGEMVSNQSLSFLVTYFLGPAMLAVYSRPQSLVRQVQTLASKFGFILLPTASSLQAQTSDDQVRITLCESTRHLGALGMPVAVTMALAGDFVISLWMGPEYVYPGLVTVMALASLPVWIMEPVWSILAGLNQHGRLGWGKVAGSLLSALSLVAAFTLGHTGLLGAAVAFSVPQLVVNAVVTPVIACRRIGLPLRQFYWEAFGRPFVCVLPYAWGLGFAVWLLPGHTPEAVGSALLGLIATSLTYWLYILPSSWRKKIQMCRPFRSTIHHPVEAQPQSEIL